MKNKFTVLICCVAAAVFGGILIWRQSHTAPGVNSSVTIGAPLKFPLQAPTGVLVSVFAKNVPGARALLFDNQDHLLVSLTQSGIILSINSSGASHVLASGLNQPHGLALSCASEGCTLFVAETNRIIAYQYNEQTQTVFGGKKIADLPDAGNGHATRSLLIHDNKLLVSVGSSCNVCRESDPRRAAVLEMNLDGSDQKVYSSGLRNAVFLATNPATDEVWVTENGRDNLNDNTPPDEINILREGKDYGWPYCYGQNIHDDGFDPGRMHSCAAAQGSFVDIPAHSAPLGLAFFPGVGWPDEDQHQLLVAYHGSWNRSVPTGFKIVKIQLDQYNNYVGSEDFITGWLGSGQSADAAYGRPVDLAFDNKGALYISDDKAGVIYRAWYTKPTGSGKSCQPGLACQE